MSNLGSGRQGHQDPGLDASPDRGLRRETEAHATLGEKKTMDPEGNATLSRNLFQTLCQDVVFLSWWATYSLSSSRSTCVHAFPQWRETTLLFDTIGPTVETLNATDSRHQRGLSQTRRTPLTSPQEKALTRQVAAARDSVASQEVPRPNASLEDYQDRVACGKWSV